MHLWTMMHQLAKREIVQDVHKSWTCDEMKTYKVIKITINNCGLINALIKQPHNVYLNNNELFNNLYRASTVLTSKPPLSITLSPALLKATPPPFGHLPSIITM